MKFTFDQKLMVTAVKSVKVLSLGVAVSLTACSTINPPRDTSTLDRINDQFRQATTPSVKIAEPALPAAVSSSLLPPPRMPMPKASSKQLEQRFDLVVTDAPIHQVLMGLVHDTKYSIMVKPKNSNDGRDLRLFSSEQVKPGTADAAGAVGLAEKVTINLKNVTVFEALDSIRDVYGYDYSMEGNRIYVQQPELQTRLYQVNYIIGQRRGVSDLQVIGGASAGALSSSSSSGTSGSTGTTGTTGASGNTTSSNYSSVQTSALSTVAKSDLWGEVEDTLRTTLGCQIPSKSKISAADAQASASTSGTSRADVLFYGDTTTAERQRGVNGCSDGRSMSINQMSGTVLVRGMPNEHRMIGQMLRSMQLNIERQVIIEAKIIDVELNTDSQQGINWAAFEKNRNRFSVGADSTVINANTFVDPVTGTTTTLRGAINEGTSLGGLLGGGMVGASAANAFSAGLGMAVQNRNFLAMINFLQTQGHVHVLSSPRIATLNSQKAVLKVGSEEPFVTNISGGTTNITNGISQTIPPTLQYQPFFSGISLDVTPQIDEKDNITLHVHAMVNSIIEKEKISQPTAGAVRVPFAVNTISETDNVIKTKDGQVVVIGGLMTESNRDDRAKVPGAGDVPVLGAFFSKGGQTSVKRELVILLKPTVVKDDSDWSNDIDATQARVERLTTGNLPIPKP